MKPLLTIGFLLLGMVCSYAQLITHAEYFFDLDPGPGNGTPVPGIVSDDTLTFSVNPSTTSLSLGFHFVGIRVKDQNNRWSHYALRNFYLFGAPVGVQNIAAAEYFFDQDPGLGNGAPLPIGPPDDSLTFMAMIPQTLQGGFHFLAVRVKDLGGQWSLFEKRNFYISPTPVGVPNIVAAEYFVDQDPGPGNGIAIPIGPQDDSLTFIAMIPQFLPGGFHILSIRVKDLNGQWSLFEKRTFYISPVPVSQPTITAAEYFIETDPGPGNGISVSLGPPADTINQPTTVPIPSTTPLGTYFYALRAEDATGKWSHFQYDTVIVALSVPEDTAVTASPGLCTRVVNGLDAITINSEPYSYTLSGATTGSGSGSASGLSFNAGTTTITYTLDNFPTAFASFTITVTDDQMPSITCPPNITVGADEGICGAVVNYTVTFNDNCPSPVLTLLSGLASGSAFPAGPTVNTYRVTDASGNSTTCSFTVTVTDDVSPVITCPANITVNTDPGLCTASNVMLGSPTTSDNCGLSSTNHNGLSVYPLGSTPVTWTSTDVNGNTSTCIQTVTVTDNQNPAITCPANITMNADPGTCTKTVTYAATASDNCAISGIMYAPPSGSTFSVGTTIVTATATDVNGRTSTCTFSVTVSDTEDPVITCPANITVNADPGQCTDNVTFSASATDNCGTPVISFIPASGSAFPVGTTMVTATATDGGGRTDTCSFSVTVLDNQPPSISCPANITVNTDAGLCTASSVSLGSPVVSDNCGGVMTSNNGPSVYAIGTTNVIWTVTDVNGLTTSCVQTVTVADNQNPSITCPANITMNADPGTCTKTVTYAASASDNCGVSGISYMPASGSTFSIGTTIVTATATDVHGRTSSCTFNVTIVDSEDPVITCPANITVNADPGQCTDNVTFSASATDNCGTPVISFIPASGSAFPVGTTMVTATATDGGGRTDTCSFSVTVLDNQPPSITCPALVYVFSDPGVCTASNVSLGVPVQNDNCGIATVSNNAPAQFPVGITPVVWTITDVNGLTSTCTQIVEVVDNQVPVITLCPPDTTVYTGQNDCWAEVDFIFSGTDNCAISSIVSIPFESGEQFSVGTSVVTILATDVHGNTSTCSFTVTVIDTISPVLDCPTLSGSGVPPDACELQVFFSINAIDNCPPTPVVLSNPPSGSVFPVGTTIVTATTTDNNGNTSACTFPVVVTDDHVPSVTCPSNLTINMDPGLCTASNVSLGLPINEDNCGIDTVYQNAPMVFPEGNTNVSWTVVDIHDNSSQCIQSITVVDNQPPIIDCPDNIVAFAAPGGQPVIVNYPAPDVTDNCGILSIQQTTGLPSGSTFPPGTTTNTFLVTDAHGMTAMCSFTVHVKIGKVGVNTITPLAILHVADSSVLFNGPAMLPVVPAPPPIQGPGKRFMWYGDKAAFRAGAVSGTQWNSENIGKYSVGMGYNVQASGENAVAIGSQSSALGNLSIALGSSNLASGSQSFAAGYKNAATGTQSTAVGDSTTSMGAHAFSLGSRSQAIADYAMVLGYQSKSTGNRAIAVSSNNNARSYGCFVCGQYNDTTSISTSSFNTMDPVFIAGNGTAVNDLKNAMTVLKNGKAGLFTAAPAFLFHVATNTAGSLGFKEGVRIENTSNTLGEPAITFKNKSIPDSRQWITGLNESSSLSFNYGESFITATNKLFLDTLGRMGIGMTSPAAQLHVRRNAASGGTFASNALAIFESSNITYLQASSSTTSAFGILSGNASTSIRSGIIFSPDSALIFKSGGDIDKFKILKNGNVGIGTITPNARLDVNGSTEIGSNGTILQEIIKATVNLDIPNIDPTATVGQLFAIPNAAVGSTIYVSPQGSLPDGFLITHVHVSIPGLVQMYYRNASNVPVNPDPMDFYFVLIR